MDWLFWTLGTLGGAALLVLCILLYCYFRVFYSPRRKPLSDGEYELPPGKEFEPHHAAMKAWVDDARNMPHENLSITSRDGLTLRARYYELTPDAPVELLFHGYRGNGERDMSGGIERCFRMGRSAFIIDHRASGTSEGRTITFGIKESKDCIDWVNFAEKKFGRDKKLIITGISMGGATVALMASDPELSPSVVCALCDCPYSSAREIIMKVLRDMRLPAGLVYPFVKLSARLFGGFDLEERSPIESVKNARVPIAYIHGTSDDFVPHEMSVELSRATSTPTALLLIDGAAHGVAFPTDKDGYISFLGDFQADFV